MPASNRITGPQGLRAVLAVLLVVALGFVGIGHQTTPQSEAMARAYLLAGGDWADLCGDGETPFAHSAKCSACLISKTCTPPQPWLPPQPLAQALTLRWQPIAAATIPAADNLPQPARAPPGFPLI